MSYFKSTSMRVNVSHILSIPELFTPPGFPLSSMPGIVSVSVLWGQAYSWQEEVVLVSEICSHSQLLVLLLNCFFSAVPLFPQAGPQTNPPGHALVPQAPHWHTDSCLTLYRALIKTV